MSSTHSEIKASLKKIGFGSWNFISQCSKQVTLTMAIEVQKASEQQGPTTNDGAYLIEDNDLVSYALYNVTQHELA